MFFYTSENSSDIVGTCIMVLPRDVKFIPTRAPGVHSSDISCYCSVNDSFFPSNIYIPKCDVSSQQHNAPLNYLLLPPPIFRSVTKLSAVKLKMAFGTLSE